MGRYAHAAPSYKIRCLKLVIWMFSEEGLDPGKLHDTHECADVSLIDLCHRCKRVCSLE